MKAETTFDAAKFLEENAVYFERVKEGVDAHPSQSACEKFEELAIGISPKGDFSWRGCQSCINYVIKFVYENAAKLKVEITYPKGIVKVAKMTFPKQDEAKK